MTPDTLAFYFVCSMLAMMAVVFLARHDGQF